MNRRLCSRWIAVACMSTVLAWAGAARSDEPTRNETTQTTESVTVVVSDGDPASPAEAGSVITLDVNLVKPGEYWLGVICSPLEDSLLMGHLGIEQGILVKEIVPDSPAAQAGLQPQDILIQVGDQPLNDLQTLVASTEKAQDQAITLTLIRKGQQQTVEVTPAKRPDEPAGAVVLPDPETAEEWQQLQQALRTYQFKLSEVQGDPHQTKMLFVMPGFVLPEQAKDFPQDLEVTLTKKGQDPAKMTVRRGEQQWEVDANSLDQLPEDIRPHVQQMFGRGVEIGVGQQIGKHRNWTARLAQPLLAEPLEAEAMYKSRPPGRRIRMELRGTLGEKLPAELRQRIESQLQEAQGKLNEATSAGPDQALEEIRAELQELRQLVDALRAERAAPPAAESEPK